MVVFHDLRESSYQPEPKCNMKVSFGISPVTKLQPHRYHTCKVEVRIATWH